MGECYLLFLQKLKNNVPPERIKKTDHFSKKLLEDKWVFSYCKKKFLGIQLGNTMRKKCFKFSALLLRRKS